MMVLDTASWITIGAAVIGAGASASNSHQNRKAAKTQNDIMSNRVDTSETVESKIDEEANNEAKRRERLRAYQTGEIYTSPTGLNQAGSQTAINKLR